MLANAKEGNLKKIVPFGFFGSLALKKSFVNATSKIFISE